jgi:hypothetical protein
MPCTILSSLLEVDRERGATSHSQVLKALLAAGVNPDAPGALPETYDRKLYEGLCTTQVQRVLKTWRFERRLLAMVKAVPDLPMVLVHDIVQRAMA